MRQSRASSAFASSMRPSRVQAVPRAQCQIASGYGALPSGGRVPVSSSCQRPKRTSASRGSTSKCCSVPALRSAGSGRDGPQAAG
jgi:hypothetical protein